MISGINGGRDGFTVVMSSDRSRNGQNPIEQLIRGLMTRMQITPENRTPTDRNIIDSLPVVRYDKSNPDHQQSTSCTICVTDFEDGDQLVSLPCGHLFNKECIVPWLKNSSLCPNCRQNIRQAPSPLTSTMLSTLTNETSRASETKTYHPQSIVRIQAQTATAKDALSLSSLSHPRTTKTIKGSYLVCSVWVTTGDSRLNKYIIIHSIELNRYLLAFCWDFPEDLPLRLLEDFPEDFLLTLT